MDKLSMSTPNLTSENIEKIADLFPWCIVEAEDELGNKVRKVDFDLLKAELWDQASVEWLDERYRLDWPGKKRSILKANTPITKTLRPVKEDSVDWDTTQNLYIEGDNFEVLKILQESYLGKVKMIYIDPPYNTGNDFVYNDDFSQDASEYREKTEQNAEWYKMVRNMETNGRFHSDWLSMMYERLKIARDLLMEEGVLFMSIDENEFVNLKKVTDEIFWEGNYIENFIWIKNATKNLSRTTSTNHEYILCYAKNINSVEEAQSFRKKKDWLSSVKKILDKAQKNNATAKAVQDELRSFYRSHPELKWISMYNNVEYNSELKCLKVYTLDNISAPKSTWKAATYEILHPKTGRPCKSPSSGWRFTRTTMDELIKKNMIEFYDNENHVPRVKRYLDTVETDVIKSIIEDNTDGKKELARLFDSCPFDNPKPTTLFNVFLNVTRENDIILDFFSWSATLADAVLQQNATDWKNRRYIMVQLPEFCDNRSEAYKMWFRKITELWQKRIKLCAQKIKEETWADIDYWFRVYRVDESCMKDVFYHPSEAKQEDLWFFTSNIKEDRTPEDLLTQVILNFGLTLDLPIEEKQIWNSKVFYVAWNSLLACFDDNILDETIEIIAKEQPIKLVFRDSCFKDDSQRINVENKVKRLSPDTIIKVI